MSRQFRQRATGVTLAALFALVPLLAIGSAHADPVEAGNGDLVFDGGGVLGLSCAAEPRSAALSVPAGSTVRVINGTGHDAELRLDGVSKGAIADQSSSRVLFRRGPVAVTLRPNCVIGGESTPVMVTVTPAASVNPSTPVPLPTIDPTSAPPAITPTTVGPTTATATPSRPRPPRSTTTTKTQRPSAVRTTTRATPRNGTTTRTRTRATATTTAARAARTMSAGPTGLPLGGDPAPDPSGEPVLAVPDMTPSGPAAAAAEPVAALEPLSGPKPVGLLALAATICVFGVGAGAIRAIAAERAYRTTIA
jgi:hypothetical protein